MTDLTDIKKGVTKSADRNFKSSNTHSRETSHPSGPKKLKSDFISKFESSLQKTLEVIHDYSKKEQTFGEQNENQDIARPFCPLQDIRNMEAINNFSPKHCTCHFTNREIKPKSAQSTVRNMRYLEHNYEISQEKYTTLNQKVQALETENEQLRLEISKVKTDSYKKYEILKRNNDELLVSYEERSQVALRNMKEHYENEIKELKEEIEQLKDMNKKTREAAKLQKEKMNMAIMELEKEKQELSSKISRLQVKSFDIQPAGNSLYQSQKGDSSFVSVCNPYALHSPSFVNDQTPSDKKSFEKRYYDLFTSYNLLLEHNKALLQKLEGNNERGSEPKSQKKRKRSSPEDLSAKFYLKKDLKGVESRNKKSRSSINRNKSHREHYPYNSFFSNQAEGLSKCCSNRESPAIQNRVKEISLFKSKDHTMNLEDIKYFDESNLKGRSKRSGSIENLINSQKVHRKVDSNTKRKTDMRSPSNISTNRIVCKESKHHNPETENKILAKRKNKNKQSK